MRPSCLLRANSSKAWCCKCASLHIVQPSLSLLIYALTRAQPPTSLPCLHPAPFPALRRRCMWLPCVATQARWRSCWTQACQQRHAAAGAGWPLMRPVQREPCQQPGRVQSEQMTAMLCAIARHTLWTAECWQHMPSRSSGQNTQHVTQVVTWSLPAGSQQQHPATCQYSGPALGSG